MVLNGRLVVVAVDTFALARYFRCGDCTNVPYSPHLYH